MAAKDTPVVKTGKAKTPRTKTGPQKAKDADETSRVSTHPSPNEPGPAEQSEGKTSDERGARDRLRKNDSDLPHDEVLPEGERHSAGEERRRVHEEAARQPGRDTHRPTGVQSLTVDGEKVETVSTPGKLDPIELKPSKRDTVVKDQLRADGKAFHADAPVRSREGGDWHDTDVRVDLDDGPKPTKKKAKQVDA